MVKVLLCLGHLCTSLSLSFHKTFYLSDETGVPVRAINRPGSQLLGANGRDDGPVVSFLFLI